VTGDGSIEGSLLALGVTAMDCPLDDPPDDCSLITEVFAARWGNVTTP
jgi:hypothetical protein